MKNKGVLAEGLYDGIEYDGDILDWAYITVENDIVLTSYDETIVYLLKTSKTSSKDFCNHNTNNEENEISHVNDEEISTDDTLNEKILSKELEDIKDMKKYLMILLMHTEIRELELEIQLAS